MAEVDLLDFVRTCKRLAKQTLGKHAGEPATGGFARWVHVVIHCYRIEDEHSYRKTENRLEYLTEIREVLGLDQGDVPESTTIYKSFDRLKMWMWRALLRVSAQQHPQSVLPNLLLWLSDFAPNLAAQYLVRIDMWALRATPSQQPPKETFSTEDSNGAVAPDRASRLSRAGSARDGVPVTHRNADAV